MSTEHIIWLLVQKVNVPYGVSPYELVSINAAKCAGQDIRTGKLMYIQVSPDARPQQVLIRRISEIPSELKRYRKHLEIQDSKCKNTVTKCAAIPSRRKSKTKKYLSINDAGQPHSSRFAPRRRLMTPDDSSSTDEDQRKLSKLVQSLAQYASQMKRSESRTHRRSLPSAHRHRSFYSSTPKPDTQRNHIKLTFDQAIQTDPPKIAPTPQPELVQQNQPEITQVETLVKRLYRQFSTLLSKAEQAEQTNRAEQIDNSSDDISETDSSAGRSTPRQMLGPILERMEAEHQSSNESGTEQVISTSNIRMEPGPSRPKTLEVRRVSAHTTNMLDLSRSSGDMVPIGNGNATVPARLMDEINWSSYTTATRQLLQAVFPRRVLATHSLTGKQSPAFLDKPAKKCLDPKLVEDIVMTVNQRCGVDDRQVRNIITIKCTDEAKLYRNRQQCKLGRLPSQDQENMPPSSISSDTTTESSY